MKAAMARAWVTGFAILVVAYGAWLALTITSLGGGPFSTLASKLSDPLAWVLWLSPGFAGLAVAYLSPSWKLFLGISMAVVAAGLAVAFNFVYQLLGYATDFRGPRGARILFTVTLMYSSTCSTAGTVVGYLLARKRRKSGDISIQP